MASSLLALLDDIITVLDDVAILSKVAAKKTAGVLGDDLALNAQQVTGVQAERELPVVWAVAKGSFRNKLILVPAALLISFVAPWVITPLLMIGGAYLCFEGFEKLAHRFLHSHEEDKSEHDKLTAALVDPAVDLVAFEKDKIGGAVRTDFVLSAEIIVIALGTVQSAPIATQILVLSAVAILMTVGVYGFVAGIVKLDDLGLHWLRSTSAALRTLGGGLLAFAPLLMRTLSVVGTAAMFMVGGGILSHGLPFLHHAAETMAHNLAGIPLLGAMAGMLFDGIAGVVAGGVVLAGVTLVNKLVQAFRKPA
ncbi:DUF808 domain-containing protein [Viridibacterium curvum]|uniref:DUF808 domain-containing protein n=1 Tax=Viridibacterium curvum TaxID=1101404 RepID=A0ABP9Q885_9RHOO